MQKLTGNNSRARSQSTDQHLLAPYFLNIQWRCFKQIMSRTLKQFLPSGLLVVVGKMRAASRQRRVELARQKRIKSYLETHKIRKLQLGSSNNILENWLNTDLYQCRGEVVPLDVRERFPFDESTFDYIFCEHMIEHLKYHEGMDMLRECFRVLRPGGRIRLSTPNLRFLIELYNSEKTELQERYISWAVNEFLPDTGIYEDVFVINNFFRAWGHKFIYDSKALHAAMHRVGFTNTTNWKVGESEDQNFQGIERHNQMIPAEFNELETFVLEGVKRV